MSLDLTQFEGHTPGPWKTVEELAERGFNEMCKQAGTSNTWGKIPRKTQRDYCVFAREVILACATKPEAIKKLSEDIADEIDDWMIHRHGVSSIEVIHGIIEEELMKALNPAPEGKS